MKQHRQDALQKAVEPIGWCQIILFTAEALCVCVNNLPMIVR